MMARLRLKLSRHCQTGTMTVSNLKVCRDIGPATSPYGGER